MGRHEIIRFYVECISGTWLLRSRDGKIMGVRPA